MGTSDESILGSGIFVPFFGVLVGTCVLAGAGVLVGVVGTVGPSDPNGLQPFNIMKIRIKTNCHCDIFLVFIYAFEYLIYYTVAVHRISSSIVLQLTARNVLMLREKLNADTLPSIFFLSL